VAGVFETSPCRVDRTVGSAYERVLRNQTADFVEIINVILRLIDAPVFDGEGGDFIEIGIRLP